MSLLTLELLAESARHWKAKTYSVLVRDSIGWLPSKFSSSAVTVNLFGACVGANIAMGGALDELLDDAGPVICGVRFNKTVPIIAQCFDKDLPTGKMALKKLKSAEMLGARDLDDASYMTPRQAFRDKSKANAGQIAAQPGRAKALASFFEQFNDALSA